MKRRKRKSEQTDVQYTQRVIKIDMKMDKQY